MEISNCISYSGIVSQSKHKNRKDLILCLICFLSIEFHDLFNKMQFLSIKACHGHGVDLSWANEEATASGPLNGGKKSDVTFLFPIRAGVRRCRTS